MPLFIGGTLVQQAIYDVPGGYRAVLFDRFSGVQKVVSRDSVADLLFQGAKGIEDVGSPQS